MTAAEFAQTLIEALHDSVDFDSVLRGVTAYDEAGVLTMDEGLVVTLADGSEFHLTVQQSSAAFAQE